MSFESQNPHPETVGSSRLVDEYATDDDRLFGTFMHLSVLLNHLGPVGLGFIVSLVIWLMKRDQSPFIDDHGREAINFQISLFIWYVLAGILSVCLIGLPIVLVLFVVAFVTSIVNAIRANRGEYVRYPITIRFL